ncbi:hypothetical protein BH10BAC4_BH10BAC4_18890 [soil metagenome]
MGFIYYLLDSYIISPEGPKTEKELIDIGDAKYRKKIGERFNIDSIQFTVHHFEMKEYKDSSILRVDFSFQNMRSGDAMLKSSFFSLMNDQDEAFVPQFDDVIILGKKRRRVTLSYKLPVRVLPYFIYRLYLNSQINPENRVIVSIYQNFRSEG